MTTAVAAAGGAAVLPAAQAATWQAPVFQRVMGGPASPQVYAWGTVYNPVTDELLVGDYVNKTVRRYTTDGDYLGNSDGPTNVGLYAGIAVDPRDGAFYVGTQAGGGGKVLKFNAQGHHLFTVDPPGLNVFPAVDSQGFLYLNQRTQGSYIDKFKVDDAARTVTQVQRFSAPGGKWYNDVDVAPDGRVYAVQQDQYRVRVFNADGSLANTIGSKGNGVAQFNGDMRGLTLDAARNRLYVVDGAANLVEVFTLDGVSLGTIGSGTSGQGAGEFQDGGRQVTVDSQGRVYVADYGNFRIVPFGADGTPAQPFPNPAADPDKWGFNSVMDVAVDPVDGDVVGIDSYNQRYVRFTSDGQLVGTTGRRGNGPPFGFNYPKGIGIDPATRNVWVTHQELGDPDVTVYSADGVFVREVFESQRRDAVAFDGDGRAYILAGGTISVRDTSTGAEVRRWGGMSGRNLGIDRATDRLYIPSGGQVRAYTSTGTYLRSYVGGSSLYDAVVVGDVLYATDKAAGQIVAFDLASGSVLGKIGSRGSLSGQLIAPHGIDADAAGNLYVADRNNQRISVFGPGTVPADAVSPSATLAMSNGATVAAGPVVITGSAADDASGVARVEVSLTDTVTGLSWNPKMSSWQGRLSWDDAFSSGGVTDRDWRYAFVGARPGGEYKISVRVRDRAGNVSSVKAATFSAVS